MNISATLNFFRLVQTPSLCLPHAIIPTFNQLPIPVSKAFGLSQENDLEIRAVVLDKDNCFARPKQNAVYERYEVGDCVNQIYLMSSCRCIFVLFYFIQILRMRFSIGAPKASSVNAS